MDFALKETERNLFLHLFNDYLLLSLQKEWVSKHVVCKYFINPLIQSCFPHVCVFVIIFSTAFVFTVYCFQRGKIHSNRPLSGRKPACRELPCETSLSAEKPVQAAHGAQILLAKDCHTVSDTSTWGVLQYYRSFPRHTILYFFVSSRSDKLRWMSALSRPHSPIDFSAAQGKMLILFVFFFNVLFLFVSHKLWNIHLHGWPT